MHLTKEWNKDWQFAKIAWTDADLNTYMNGMEAVTIPHTWYTDDEYFRGDGVYQKRFVLDMKEKKHAFLKFHGVDKVCKVYLNGNLIGGHQGGYSIFTVELTPYLHGDRENILTVCVNTDAKHKVAPMSGDFVWFGGIHREVELILTDEAYFDCTYWGTSGLIMTPEVKDGRGRLTVVPKIKCPVMENAKVIYTVYDADGHAAARAQFLASETMTIDVDDPVLWNGKDNPYLYQVEAELIYQDEVADVVKLPTGFRKIAMDPNKGFFLNDQHMKLNGVAKHQDSGSNGVYSAATMENWIEDMNIIEEVGANAVRLSHYQHPYQVYDLCDQMGFVVWTEIPLLKLIDDEALFDNVKQQLTELIYQNIHHPSICFWGLQNEIAIFGEKPFMYDKMERLQEYAHDLDASRLTAAANMNAVDVESPLNTETDVIAYNQYFGWYNGEFEDFAEFADRFHRVHPDRALGISEYGADANILYHSADPKVKDYSEEFQSKFHETVYPILRDRDFIWGTFVWNMFDFVCSRKEGGTKFRNNKGLVSHDRKTCKDAFYYYKAQWSKTPFVHIAEKRFAKRNAEVMNVKVYSNQKIVSISVNGIDYELTSDTGVFLFKDICLNLGENVVEAKSGSLTDRAVFERVSEPVEAYVYVDPTPVLNIKDWYVDEVEMEKLFPADAYSIKDTINDLLANGECVKIIDGLSPEVSDFIKDGIGTFSLEEWVTFAKGICTEDELKEINRKLTAIKK